MAGPATPAQRTPGRVKRAEAYVGFNARPKDVGSRTGLPMPKNISRDSDGFERANDFFDSPNGTEAPTTAHTIRTTTGVSSTLRRANRSGTGMQMEDESPIPTSKRPKLSQMAAGSDEEDGTGLGPDEIMEDDGVLSHRLSSPNEWFETNEVPKVPLPRKSMLPPPTPTGDYDDLPTPQKSGRKSRPGVGREAPSPAKSTYSHIGPSPAKSTTSSRHVADELDMELEDVEEDEMTMDLEDGDVTRNIPPTPSNKGSPAKRKAKKSTAGEEDVSRKSRKSEVSTGKNKAPARHQEEEDDNDDEEEEDEAEEEDAGQSKYRVPESMDVGTDEPFDDDGDQEDYGNGDVLQDQDQGDDEDQDDDVDMEAEAIARENESGSEDDSTPAQPRREPKRPPPKKKTVSPTKRQPRKAADRTTPSLPQKKKSRVSSINNDENDGDGYHGDFQTRKSSRRHFAPLAYWRGEHINYKPGPGLAIPAEVIRVPEDIKPLRSTRGRSTQRGRSTSQKLRRISEEREDAPEEDWDLETEPVGTVTDYKTGKEANRRVAFPKHMIQPKPVSSGDFKYQKVFGEDQFHASGMVYIPVRSLKPAKQSKDNSYMFYVIRSAVQVTIHRTSFVIGPGGLFMIPRGNEYKIENIGDVEAELFFSQSRKMRTGEDDDAAFEALASDRRRSVSVAASQGKHNRESMGSLRGTQENDDEEEDEEEEEEEVEEERPKVRVKGRRSRG